LAACTGIHIPGAGRFAKEQKMTSSERVNATFAFQKADRVPVYHLGLSSEVASKILGHEAYIGGGMQRWREATALWAGKEAHEEFLERSMNDAFEISDAMEMDIIRAEYWRLPQKPYKKIDDCTFMYGDDNRWQIRRFFPETELFDVVESWPPPVEQTFSDLEKILDKQEAARKDYDPARTFRAARAALQRAAGKKAVRVNAGHMSIPVEPLWLEATCLAPELVERHLALQADKGVRDIQYLSTLKDVHYIFGGGDMASEQGPLFSPDTFRALMLPALQRLSAACQETGFILFFCCDGNLWPVADDLFGRSGVEGYCEVDRHAGMDLARLREAYPRLRLIGNIGSATLHSGTPSAVTQEVISCMEDAKKYSGIVVGASNYIMNGTPIENIYAMNEAIAKYR
jgi:hypothetical protein